MAVRALSALVLVLVVALVLLATSKLQPIEVQCDRRQLGGYHSGRLHVYSFYPLFVPEIVASKGGGKCKDS